MTNEEFAANLPIGMSCSGNVLYETYLQFLRDAWATISPTLISQAEKDMLRQSLKPQSRIEFTATIQQMDPSTRTEYIRQLESGYADAVTYWEEKIAADLGTKKRSR